MTDGFDPQRFDHWLLLVVFVGLSLSILGWVYRSQRRH